jgi:hypothetical protein
MERIALQPTPEEKQGFRDTLHKYPGSVSYLAQHIVGVSPTTLNQWLTGKRKTVFFQEDIVKVREFITDLRQQGKFVRNGNNHDNGES